MNKYPLSFVIPVYRSENTIEKVVSGISNLDNIDWEIILINDNSPDNVDKKIRELIKQYPERITYLQLRKNCGQQAAIICGFKYVTKKYVATIDDDGQNPPVEILKMIKAMNENDYDVVYGVFRNKKHSFFRNLSSKMNSLISIVTINNKNKISISNVRLLKNNITDFISCTSAKNNYFDGLIFSLTDHVGQVVIEHKERIDNTSSYNLGKLIKVWINHIIGYSNVLIKSVIFASFLISIVSFIVGLIYLLLTINNQGRPSGWLSTYLTITLLFCMMFLILGIISEYIGRIYSKITDNNTQIINPIHIHAQKDNKNT